MGGIHSHNNFANFWDSALDSIGDGTAGGFEAIGDTLKGITTGKFDYTSMITNFSNSTGADLSDAFGYRNDDGGFQRVHNPLSSAQQELQRLKGYANPDNFWNQLNSKEFSNHIAGSAFGVHMNPLGNTKPSDILKIGNPQAKLASSTLRGNSRNNFQSAMNVMDTRFAPSANSASGNPSAITNAGGGHGPAQSFDAPNANTNLSTQSAPPGQPQPKKELMV